MNQQNKKISAQGILALKEALSVIFWKKEQLKDFVKLTLNNSSIVNYIDWSGSKRESVKELLERMTNRLDIYRDDLMNLILAVTDFNDYSHLEFWDEDGSKRKKAKLAVEKLRTQTKGYIQITKEKDDARKRKLEVEKRIAKSKSLDDELIALKNRFIEISMMTNLQKRGFELEPFLNDLFLLYDLDPKGSFKNYGEQIDGAFTFDNTDYLMEAKWKRQVDRSDLASFTYKVETKLRIAMGLMVTIDGLTPQAIAPEFKSIIIMDGVDIMAVLEGRVKLPDLLYRKRRKANETGKIYVNYFELIG
ncbi:hypothetical protein SAMN05192588_1058 [Nonlabens sp. Hel1_33_55]|uniref:hypothetical protein n=1 Tax=Nonlabens sp. Hel1_33_55 TaxID=1336802 RepID=UPI000875CAC0|nr:hypothetical protein [Nonlabens sp. Hel1_33_55]SCY08453.1 hypothetical protein SAMN05192588_1058 [Nonlabens sp. Hel1_33_55]